MRKEILLGLILLFFSINNIAQERIENSFQGTRFVNSQSANLVEKGELQLLIQHRFGDISGGFYELFGLDQASMRLGFEYGFANNFNVGIGRSTWLKTFDAFVKLGIFQQTSDFPFSAVISTGGSLPTIRDYFPAAFDNFSDKASGNIQLHVAKTVGRIGLQVSPGYLKTGYLNDINRNLSVFTLGTSGSVSVSKKVAVNAEYLVPFSDEISGENSFSIGVDLDTGGHLFQLILSNNQRMFHQAIYTNTTGEWAGSLFFGFNLIREFDINKPLEF